MTDQVTNRGHPKENGEIFVDIPGYEGDYQISNYGNVRSLKKIPYFILKPMIATNGYLIVCLWKNGKPQRFSIHRLVATAFVNNPENYDEVNHKDEDKTNNRADNLEWCSHKYNMNYGTVRDKISKANTGKTAWSKGKVCPQITEIQLGKAHPHKGHAISEETKAKISAAKKGVVLSEERKRQIGLDTANRRWINDGYYEKFVRLDAIETYTNMGWQTGRLARQ